MFGKLTLALGFGAGYVLGAKAGRERYEQIMAKAREFSGQPAVQDATSKVTATASSVAETAKAKVNETVEKASDKADDAAASAKKSASGGGTAPDPVVDLTASGAPATSTTAPMAGAAASDTV